DRPISTRNNASLRAPTTHSAAGTTAVNSLPPSHFFNPIEPFDFSTVSSRLSAYATRLLSLGTPATPARCLSFSTSSANPARVSVAALVFSTISGKLAFTVSVACRVLARISGRSSLMMATDFLASRRRSLSIQPSARQATTARPRQFHLNRRASITRDSVGSVHVRGCRSLQHTGPGVSNALGAGQG